jgi:hypothetical protein
MAHSVLWGPEAAGSRSWSRISSSWQLCSLPARTWRSVQATCSLDDDRRCALRLGAIDRLHHPDSRQPCYREKDVGYVEHLFEPDGTARHNAFVPVPGLRRLDITDFPEAAHGVKL